MVTQISSLIVAPEVNASKYVTGAQDKVAADKAMVASANEAGAAQRGLSVVLTDTSAKISTTGDNVARLERTYVQGAKQALMFERDLNALNRAIVSGKTDIADAANILVGMNQKLGLSADASSVAALGQSQLAAAVSLANDRIRQQTTLLHDVAIAEARAAQMAENQRQVAAANQGKFNQILGVGTPTISASASASAFQVEFDRLDMVAAQKAEQIGRNFGANLDASLIAGTSKAARDSAAIFQAELSRLDEIASLKAQQVGGIFQSDLNSSFGIGVSAKSASASASVFEEAGREAEVMARKVAALRAELNPLAAAQDRVNAEIAEYAALAQRGMISADEFAQAQAMVRARGGESSGMARAAAFSAGQQVQDIAMMSMLGQAPVTIGLQQGPQLASAIAMGGGIAALRAGLASVFTMTTLLTVGITVAAAATVQWFMKGKDGADKMADAIAKSDKAVRGLADAYNIAGINAEALARKSVMSAEAAGRVSERELQRELRSYGKEVVEQTGQPDRMTFGLFETGRENIVAPRFAAFSDPVLELRKVLSSGKGDFATLERIRGDIEVIANRGYSPFRTFVDDMARMVGLEPEGIRETADALQLVIDKASDAAQRLDALKNLNTDRSRRRLPLGILDGRQEAGRELLEQQRRERMAQFANDEERLAAQLQQQRARTNAERLAAAERMALAEGGDVRSDVRVRRALAEERTRQEVEARDAAIQRAQSIERSLQQQRLELDLIGKTGGEQAKLRFEFERMQELREQAARTGAPIDQKEVASIKAAADAMGQYADALARARLADDLQFERDQLFRSPVDQQIASRLRGTGLGLGSPEAQAMRENDQISRIKGVTDTFFETFQAQASKRGASIGEALADALRAAAIQGLTDIGKQAMGNLSSLMTSVIANALGIGGSVQGSPLPNVGTVAVGSLLGGANDNYAPGAVTRSPLPNIGSGLPFSVENAAGFIRQYASAIGIDPNIALKVARSEGLGEGIWQSNFRRGGFREPSYGPFQLLKGGPGTGYGKGLGNLFQQKTGLDPADPANWQQSTAFALEQAKAGGWGPWYGAKNQGITGFTGIDKSAAKATDALDKLATSSLGTAQDLAGGLGKLGGMMNQFPGAPAGGAGGLLGNLFGGLSSAFSGTKAFSFLSANPGKFINFYADGTEGAPPGWAWVGERGPELMRMRGGETIRSHQRSMQMVAENAGGGPLVVVPTVRIQMDQDGNWKNTVERIAEGPAKQESTKAVSSYAGGQRRGGAASDDHYYKRLKRPA